MKIPLILLAACTLLASAAAAQQKPLVKVPAVTPATSTSNAVLAPPNDDCSSPTPLAGTGTFPYDTTTATMGAQGQANAACNSYGTNGIDFDVWYQWSPGATGLFLVDTCGQTGDDTKVAVYDVLGCPGTGVEATTCNDDNCNSFQSGVTVCVTNAAQVYTIQLGHYPTSSGGVGTFTIANVGACIPNDGCATPQAISGTGLFGFDNTYASAGPQGQNNALCALGPINIPNDVWFTWPAPSNGALVAQTCGLTAIDSKLALYDGAGCPLADAIACSDDDCVALESSVSYAVTGGQSYTIQLGTYPGAAGGPGQLEIQFTPSGCSGNVTVYCTPKITSNNCTPSIAGNGTPSLANPGAFTIDSSSLEDNKFGLTFFGTTGQNAVPFQGGILCVKSPVYRLLLKNTGGTTCAGTLSYTLADVVAHPSGGPLVVANQQVNCQSWFRDPGSPSTTGLTDGLQFVACP